MRRSSRLLLALLALLLPTQLVGQEEGVRLGLLYQPEYQPGLVILPFAVAAGVEASGAAQETIVKRDLDFSDRFEIKPGPTTVQRADRPDLALWKERGADWVLQGWVTPAARGESRLRLVLHDAVYGRTKGDQTFDIPEPGDPRFRMAVHAASDQVVRWATGGEGQAASRIAFVRQGRGTKEIYLVDFDGENVQRVTDDGSIALSPAWSPDGQHIAYTSYRDDAPRLYERNLATGRDRLLSGRDGINITPAYAPDGQTIAFATTIDGSTEIVTWDRARGCCMRQQTRGRFSDALSPSFSPDGRRIALVSNRLGEPHVYVMELGGEPRIISDYVYGRTGYNTSPDWSPRGDQIAYHGRVAGVHQILVVDLATSQRRLLTNVGINEDPSWAPDGRHVVFASKDREGGGLFILDTISGRVRTLLRGVGYGLPDWSPLLLRAGPAAAQR